MGTDTTLQALQYESIAFSGVVMEVFNRHLYRFLTDKGLTAGLVDNGLIVRGVEEHIAAFLFQC